MTAWRDLYDQHRGIRRVSRDFATSIRQRLIALAKHRHCAKTIEGRFTRRDCGGLREWFIQPLEPSDAREPLLGLPSLRDARLTVLALLSRKADHVHQFTAMIEGKTPGGLLWAAAVHLEGDRGGGRLATRRSALATVSGGDGGQLGPGSLLAAGAPRFQDAYPMSTRSGRLLV